MPATKRAAKHAYDVHPSLAMFQKTLAGLKAKTGRTLEEWTKFVNKEGPATEKERREWLKAKHGLGTNYAWWIAEQSVGKGDNGSPETYLKQAEEYVEEMYAGAKEALRPIFEELLALGRSLGNDVKVCPCQTMVPFYRKHVFAQIKPATRTRIDFGLALKDTKVPKTAHRYRRLCQKRPHHAPD
ncbi:MAG TPA: DUF5655 domain-containing protein [Candidatus Angelobacter sp.]|nr:DUF5655 domain-containing protein [Candidatus Angelobacter sp.]